MPRIAHVLRTQGNVLVEYVLPVAIVVIVSGLFLSLSDFKGETSQKTLAPDKGLAFVKPMNDQALSLMSPPQRKSPSNKKHFKK